MCSKKYVLHLGQSQRDATLFNPKETLALFLGYQSLQQTKPDQEILLQRSVVSFSVLKVT